MKTEIMFSSANDVWDTPQWLFEALDKEFGFTLDPCSNGDNKTVNVISPCTKTVCCKTGVGKSCL